MFARQNHLRRRGDHDHARVTYVELFFDLVFVFAVTQLSHGLLAHMSLLGAVETGLLMMAVWWVWIYTSWITNWLDPDRTTVRLMLFALMAAALVMSSSIPKAFGERGYGFAGAYIFMQVGRSLFMLWALKRHDAVNYRNFQRIIVWLSTSAVFWIAGASVEGAQRIALWAAAIGIEYVSPAVSMWVPGLGRSAPEDWKIDGAHLAERCALFVIIALGESLLVTGATFAEMPWDRATVASFLAAFLGSVAMWAVYFNVGAERGSHRLAAAEEPGRLARGYTYLHILIVAGIIVSAVADELALAHPDHHAEFKTGLIMIGGPMIYLLGTGFFKKLTSPRFPLSHVAGLVLLALLGTTLAFATPLMLTAATTAIVILVAVLEWASLRDRRRPPPRMVTEACASARTAARHKPLKAKTARPLCGFSPIQIGSPSIRRSAPRARSRTDVRLERQ